MTESVVTISHFSSGRDSVTFAILLDHEICNRNLQLSLLIFEDCW